MPLLTFRGETAITHPTIPPPSLNPIPSWTWTRRDWWIGLGLVGLAVLARWLVIGRALDQLEDPDGYLRLARSLVAGEGLRINGRLTAYRPPLYPLLLAPLVSLGDGPSLAGWLSTFHLVLGGTTVALVGTSARQWGLGRAACGIAALIAAFDPVLLVQARTVMTETLAACLLALALWGAMLDGSRGPIVAGIGFGLAALCRPSLLPAPLLAAVIALLVGPPRWADRLTRSLTLIVASLAVACPWAVRNALIFGEPVWTTTHGGYTLALANNDAYYRDVVNGPSDAVWSGVNQTTWIRSINAATAGLAEPDADRFLRQAAIACAANRPGDFTRAIAARLGRFWGVMPAAMVYTRAVRWAVAAWTVPVWGFVLVGLMRTKSWRWPGVVAPATLLTLTAIHAVYWTDLRMRAPLVPSLALLVAAGIQPIFVRRWPPRYRDN